MHNGFGVQHAEEYLNGSQWWENHRRLSHREKMIELALRHEMGKAPAVDVGEETDQESTATGDLTTPGYRAINTSGPPLSATMEMGKPSLTQSIRRQSRDPSPG